MAHKILRLTLEGKELANVEGWFGTSDPFFELSVPSDEPDGWQRVHRSAHIMDNLNPRWKEEQIDLDLLCGGDLKRPIQVAIFDWEDEEKHTPMGLFVTTVSDLLDASGDPAVKFTPIQGGEDFGSILVLNAQVGGESDDTGRVGKGSALHLILEGRDMANVEGWLSMGVSDPFFVVEASDDATNWKSVYKSEHVDDNLNPRWKTAKVALDDLCDLDLDGIIRVSIFDWEEDGKHNAMGHFETTVNGLLRASVFFKSTKSITYLQRLALLATNGLRETKRKA